AGGKSVDLEPRRGNRRLPGGPAAGRRHLERRNAALGPSPRDHRRAPPGRRESAASQPPPQGSAAADQSDYPREDVREAHLHASVVGILIALSLPRHSVMSKRRASSITSDRARYRAWLRRSRRVWKQIDRWTTPAARPLFRGIEQLLRQAL